MDTASDPYAGIDDPPTDPPSVDCLLLVSFGGPEGPADVRPFLERVTRGRGVPAERLDAVERQYLETVGGVSPLNAQARALVSALEAELASSGPDLPVYWGNRNWHPLLDDVLATMRADGRRHALQLTTSAFPSYSGCRQYREDVWRARAGEGPLVTKLRHYYAEEGFLEPVTDAVRAELEGLAAPTLVFTAHSLPVAADATSGPEGHGYTTALRSAAASVADRLGLPFDLVFQSRSGPPSVPWLEPDVNDHLRGLAPGAEVVLVPIGFTSDHVEVLFDLDVEARRTAAERGVVVRRAATVGTAPAFVRMLRDLVVERVSGPERASHGAPATHDRCPATCCPAPRRGA